MRQIQIGILIIMVVFIEGCTTTSKIITADKTREDLRDVFVLTILVRDYLRNKDGRDFNLDKLIEYDILGRISKNFEKIELISRGGHIVIRYKFSKKRDYKIEFTEKEKQLKENWKVIEKKNIDDFDGEIQFEYGERFYNFRKIIIILNRNWFATWADGI
ncbi:MAG: hypothetical protein H7Y04_01210 [Verrucomicrobia bacterium]|nr:hypothetical protein [Cytophagales bacterium]